MLVKKIAVIMSACLILGALAVAPAQAGVGGCGNSAKIPVAATRTAHASPVLDALRWILPSHVLDYAMAWMHSNDNGSNRRDGKASTEGVGGCYGLFGVGGCKL